MTTICFLFRGTKIKELAHREQGKGDNLNCSFSTTDSSMDLQLSNLGASL